MKTPKVSIVIVSWNTRDLVIDCIDSIATETQESFEVILVDNASKDGTAEAVAKRFPETVIVQNTENRGFAAANNQGVDVATGQYVLLLNPDTVILDGAIDRCLKRIESPDFSDVGALGCQVWETPEKIQLTGFAFPGPRSIFEDYLGGKLLMRILPFLESTSYSNWDRRSDRSVDVVSGMFMLIPMPIITDLGLFDEQYYVYAEEADFCFKLEKNGHRREFWAGARILHLDGGSKSTEQIRPKMYAQLLESTLRFIRKNRGRASWMATWLIYFAGLMARMIVGSLFLVIRGRESDRKRILVWSGAIRWMVTGRKPI